MNNSQLSPNYVDAGFNKFFTRAINTSFQTDTLQQISNRAGSRSLNFDQISTSGSLGDKIQVGGVIIDGTNRRIVIQDENGIEVGWIGNLDG